MRARLARWLARRDRGRLVHRMVLALLPWAIARRFDPAAARGLEATLELAIRHHARPARYALAIASGRCSVGTGAPARAGARAAIGADDLILLAGGAVTWPQLLSSGRFELTGDPFLALRFAGLFRLPVVLDEAPPAPAPPRGARL
jgi:SCP-2 sterol transfer family protein